MLNFIRGSAAFASNDSVWVMPAIAHDGVDDLLVREFLGLAVGVELGCLTVIVAVILLANAGNLEKLEGLTAGVWIQAEVQPPARKFWV